MSFYDYTFGLCIPPQVIHMYYCMDSMSAGAAFKFLQKTGSNIATGLSRHMSICI